jgi:hypothetical protein
MNEDCPGMEGICEANSYCSFPDLECPSQRRWHDRATESLAGNCLDPAADTLGGSATDSDTDPMGGSSSGEEEDSGDSAPMTSTTEPDSTSGADPSGDPTGDPSGDPSTGTPGTSSGTGASACDDVYGAAPDYMLCEEMADSCSFNVTIDMAMSCNDVCTTYGGTCVGAELNDVELCTSTGAGTCDQMDVGNLICVCSLG